MTPEHLRTKQQWRTKLKADRSAMTASTHAREARSLASAVLEHLATLEIRTVCGYVPIGSEPGLLELFDQVRDQKHRVLLPVVVGGAPLDWAEYTGPESLHGARYGLREPSGVRLGSAAIHSAGMVLVPALAVDHRGVRLGRGAGHYDRSLPLASPTAQRAGVIYDNEFVPELPGEDHDVRMNAVLTPRRGLIPLPL